MKVLAINGSPRMDKGNTALILTPFLEGMEAAGAEVKLFYTQKLQINPCQGEFHCWTKEPGVCFQQDDMQTLYPKLRESEIWVLATPVYVDGISGPLKNLMDRFLPMVQPFFELRDGHCRHPGRDENRGRKLVLVSNSGFWERDNFDPVVMHMEAFCKNAALEFAGALLRPHGPALQRMIRRGSPVDDVLLAARVAGSQIVAEGKISPHALETVSRELLPLEMYMRVVNRGFTQSLAALGAP
jgi:multimeric flavodoxin WrbA